MSGYEPRGSGVQGKGFRGRGYCGGCGNCQRCEMRGYEPRGSGVQGKGFRGKELRGGGIRGNKGGVVGVRGAIRDRLGKKPAGFDEKKKKWDEILGKKKEKVEQKEKGEKEEKIEKSRVVVPRSEKDKRLNPNSQEINPSTRDDELTFPKRPLADPVDDVADACSTLSVADASSASGSSSACLDDFEQMVAAEEEGEEDYVFA